MEYKNVPYVQISEMIESYYDDLATDQVQLVVVGANDASIPDFVSNYLGRHNVRALLIEPSTIPFAKLKEKFAGDSKYILEKLAISNVFGTRLMYTLSKDEQLPEWTAGLGSLNKRVLEYHDNQIPNLTEHVIKERVKCVPLNAVLKKHGIDTIHILQIDTEGHDYEIIKSIDFKKYRPGMIILEYAHLTIYEYYTCINLLEANQYLVSRNVDSFDLVAVDKQLI